MLGRGDERALGSWTSSAVPIAVPGLDSGVTAISLALVHACAVVDSAAWCWGQAPPFPSPINPRVVVGWESGVSAIAAGDFYTCAVVSGIESCMGENNGFGRLGTGGIPFVLTPSPVLLGDEIFVTGFE